MFLVLLTLFFTMCSLEATPLKIKKDLYALGFKNRNLLKNYNYQIVENEIIVKRKQFNNLVVASRNGQKSENKTFGSNIAPSLASFQSIFNAIQASKADLNTIKGKEKYLELALFCGFSSYKLLRDVFHYNDEQIINLLLDYVNQIQSIFYLPSLEGKLHIILVRLEVHKEEVMNTFEGDRDKLLSSFCDYQSNLNQASDNPAHWDMALYLSSLNFFGIDSGRKNSITMGLSPIGGVCYTDNNCVIAEFGTVNDNGHPYPSAGFMSAWVAVHEMSHNLGMFHDGKPINDCPSNGYLMSSSRGTKGEVTWSTCSAKSFNFIKSDCLDNIPDDFDDKFDLRPGQRITANDQCQFYLKDNNAHVFNHSSYEFICNHTILCKSPTKLGFFSAGPALEGTYCGRRSWCMNTRCVPLPDDHDLLTIEGKWTKWSTQEKCQSSCLFDSKGFIHEKRECKNPKPLNTVKFCDGNPIKVSLCDDEVICRNKTRVQPNLYATQQCSLFSNHVKDIIANGVQVHHNPSKDWQACAIFCKTVSGTWYTPRYELNLLDNLSSFFPDGTLCFAHEKLGNFYCQNNVCKPASGRRSRFKDIEAQNDLELYNMSDPSTINIIKGLYTLTENNVDNDLDYPSLF